MYSYMREYEKRNRNVLPQGYDRHSQGYQRFTLADHSAGSVHMGVGICHLLPGGSIDIYVHANEKGIYVLDGELEFLRGREAYLLSADDYALVPYGVAHAFRNRGNKVARWLEMQSPQPKPAGGWQDTFFIKALEWPKDIARPDLGDPRTQLLGHFREQRPQTLTGTGKGLKVFQFMGREFGGHHFFMMRGELGIGGSWDLHDHPVEEFFLPLSGEAEMQVEGETRALRPGDALWAGVGACHSCRNTGGLPFLWIETQAPQFPIQNGVRSYTQWDTLREEEK